MMEDKFSERLAQLRLAKGVSAREMSINIGQCSGYINNIENKKNLPSMASFFYICDYFGITPKNFFDYESDSPEQLEVLYEYLKLLNPEQLGHITGIVKDLAKSSGK